jgi:hypothetical protein
MPYLFCILPLLFKNVTIEVGQLHFLYFPVISQKLVILFKLSFEKCLENRKNEVGQFQFKIVRKLETKCKTSM